MPRKIEPKLGVEGASKQPVIPDWPDEIVMQFREHLELNEWDEKGLLLANLKYMGGQYLRWKNQKEATPGSPEQRAALELLVNEIEGFVSTLDALDFASEGELMDALSSDPYSSDSTKLPECGFSQLYELNKRLAHVRYRAKRCINKKSKTGTKENTPLKFIIERLLDIYYETTNEIPTHNDRKNNHYKGDPQTPAGKFILAFFKHVDKNLQPREISSVLSKDLKTWKNKHNID